MTDRVYPPSLPLRIRQSAKIQSLHLPIVSSTFEPTQAIAMVMKGDIKWLETLSPERTEDIPHGHPHQTDIVA